MRSRRSLLTTVSAVAGSLAALGTAAGQETESNSKDGESNSTTNTTTNSTQAPQDATESAESTLRTVVKQQQTPTDSGPDYLAEISNGLVLQDYRTRELDDSERSKMLLDVEAQSPVAVRYADAFGPFAESGVSVIESRTVAVESGESTLGIECTEIRGQIGVSIATQDSFGIAVSTGLDQSSEDALTVAEGIGYGGGVALLGTGAAAWRRSRSDLNSPSKAGDSDGL